MQITRLDITNDPFTGREMPDNFTFLALINDILGPGNLTETIFTDITSNVFSDRGTPCRATVLKNTKIVFDRQGHNVIVVESKMYIETFAKSI